jgi:hypothetical protein
MDRSGYAGRKAEGAGGEDEGSPSCPEEKPLSDSNGFFEEKAHHLTSAILGVEIKIRAQEVARGPAPFGTLMVIQTLGNRSIRTIVCVIVVRAVLHVARIEGSHTQRTTKHGVRELERTERVLGLEKLWSNGHCDREVWSELIIRPLAARTRPVHVLVNATTVDKIRLDIILAIFCGVCRV